MLPFLPIAHAAQGIPTKVDVCKSFFNFLSLDCGSAGTDESSSIVGLVAKIVNFILGISASVALAVIIFAGIQLILASADPDRVQKARTLIINAVFGLLLIMGAYLITSAIRFLAYALPF